MKTHGFFLVSVLLMIFVCTLGCTKCKPVVDLNICENATGWTRNDCYNTGVKNANCASICEDTKDDFWKQVCYKEVAIRDGNSKLCTKISNATLIEECLKGA